MAKGIHDERYQAVVSALRDARVANALSQADLGKKLGQRQQYVSKFEAGERRLDIIEFIDVANALDLDWATLLEQFNSRPVGPA